MSHYPGPVHQTGIEFEIVSLQVDTATPAGMLVYTIISAIAEFERRLLAQRTREGLAEMHYERPRGYTRPTSF